MMYKTQAPNKSGYTLFKDIDLDEIAAFIDWIFFFHAWRIAGKYPGIETVHDCESCHESWLHTLPEKDREKGKEALKLLKDAQEMLRRIRDEKRVHIHAGIYLNEAYSLDDDIFIKAENDEYLKIPTLRQQKPSDDGFCYSLADFLDEKEDYAGVFATTVAGGEKFAEEFEKQDDVYNGILIKTLCDRLAEAAAEWIHYKVRREFWGYAAGENLTVEDMLKTKYQGIRPAVGYPSLPDQSVIFELDKLIRFNEIGIKLTENGAMYPNASVSGLYFAHPRSKYFMVGKIDENQLSDYARRKEKTTAELRKWLGANL